MTSIIYLQSGFGLLLCLQELDAADEYGDLFPGIAGESSGDEDRFAGVVVLADVFCGLSRGDDGNREGFFEQAVLIVSVLTFYRDGEAGLAEPVFIGMI